MLNAIGIALSAEQVSCNWDERGIGDAGTSSPITDTQIHTWHAPGRQSTWSQTVRLRHHANLHHLYITFDLYSSIIISINFRQQWPTVAENLRPSCQPKPRDLPTISPWINCKNTVMTGMLLSTRHLATHMNSPTEKSMPNPLNDPRIVR